MISRRSRSSFQDLDFESFQISARARQPGYPASRPPDGGGSSSEPRICRAPLLHPIHAPGIPPDRRDGDAPAIIGGRTTIELRRSTISPSMRLVGTTEPAGACQSLPRLTAASTATSAPENRRFTSLTPIPSSAAIAVYSRCRTETPSFGAPTPLPFLRRSDAAEPPIQ